MVLHIQFPRTKMPGHLDFGRKVVKVQVGGLLSYRGRRDAGGAVLGWCSVALAKHIDRFDDKQFLQSIVGKRPTTVGRLHHIWKRWVPAGKHKTAEHLADGAFKTIAASRQDIENESAEGEMDTATLIANVCHDRPSDSRFVLPWRHWAPFSTSLLPKFSVSSTPDRFLNFFLGSYPCHVNWGFISENKNIEHSSFGLCSRPGQKIP